MPNIKSAKKRVLINTKKNEANVSAKSALKTSVKKARIAIDTNADNKADAVKAAAIDLDKAAGKGLISKNAAARKKSRMAKAAAKEN